MTDQLDPIAPDRAVEMYLTSRENELSKNSLQNYKYDLAAFTDWCQQEGIDNMNDVTGRTVINFRMDRAEEVKQVTLRGNLWNLKKFLRFCKKIDAVRAGLNEKVAVPEVSTADEVNETYITSEEADAMLEYLNKYEYASFRHAVFYTLWHTGMRSGSLRSLDLGDFDPDRNTLMLRHRPETGTPLKNKANGERDVYIKDDLCDVLSDFVDMHRSGCLDDYGREPLFSTGSGRPAKTTLQRNIYTVT
ncbi:tyrosine-type recombinase/integrase [Halococcoides cellulosivorans]|uniref:Integrase n=1 Tax=Halococcoides cellulosivorans TaxID=1679096 RepID=A0A2R4X249_9EURY|nr:site-specific integrase [Halococcoides cellulosivorans]AWB27803.1 integrase [Halococcoides cellulosivorans]